MSAAGRRRSSNVARGPFTASRAVASMAFLTLVSAAVVPVALAPGAPQDPPRTSVEAEGDNDPAAGASRAAALTDLIRIRQWHMGALRVPKAWKWSKGKEVVVAVLDTGVDARHRDLTGQVITGPDYTGRTRKPGGKFWGGHGTSMASIIAGHGNGAGGSAGILGVAPQSKILSVRVTWENDDPLRESGGEVKRNKDAVAKGIRYAVDNGADVINMSLGGGRPNYQGNATEEAAVKYALSKGVVLIASAGNDGASQNRKNFPAAYPGVIAVGALDRRLKVWKDSNRHSYVSACAPGVDIIGASPANRYQVSSGTSPSAAIVAGVAALVRARYPKLTVEEVRQSLVQGVAKRSTTTSAGGAKVCPGSLDAVRAIAAANKINKAAHGPGSVRKPPATPAPTALPTSGDSNVLLMGILGGGGVLLLAGLMLGWRQRRRPEEEDDPTGVLTPDRPREPVAAMAAGRGSPLDGEYEYREHDAPLAAPTSLTPWQGADPADGMSTSQPNPTARPGTGHEPIWPPPPAATPPPTPAPTPLAGTVPPEPFQPSVSPYEPPRSPAPPPEPFQAPLSPYEPPYEPPQPSEPSVPRGVPLPSPEPLQPSEPVAMADPFRGNGHGTAPVNGNGNGNEQGRGHLDLANLQPYDAAPDVSKPALASNGSGGSGEHGSGLSYDDASLGFGAGPLGADPLAADPLGTDPLGADPLGADPLGADPLGTDPLGDGPFRGGSALPAAETPLADESWRRIRQNRAEDPVVEDDIPTGAFPVMESQPDDTPTSAVPVMDPQQDDAPTSTFPVVESPQDEVRERPEDEDDYRPPWL